jgi:ribosomal protein L37AE/L43A
MTVMACPICECALEQYSQTGYRCSSCGYNNVMAQVFGSKKVPIIKLCDYCKSENIEALSKDHISCKDCGFGWNGKPKNMNVHLEEIMELAKGLALKHPKASKQELSDLLKTELHIKENHPLDSKGWCEYCNQKFKEN